MIEMILTDPAFDVIAVFGRENMGKHIGKHFYLVYYYFHERFIYCSIQHLCQITFDVS